MSDWQPTATVAALHARARLYRQVRAFFDGRGLLEVDTPCIGVAGATDPYLDSLRLSDGHYLQTSPEFAMKRLLAAGSGPIYQISHAFRRGEEGRRHNPEFTLLEWYQPGWHMERLMDEVAQLVTALLLLAPPERLAYRTLFESVTGLNPHQASLADLQDFIRAQSAQVPLPDEHNAALDVIMTHWVEPQLASHGACFLYHFPASQAALAEVTDTEAGDPVALRFELYVNGMELANGYQELTDADEQHRRFLADNQVREAMGLPTVHQDERLLAALRAGLPGCAGVALGLDRLLMLQLGADQLSEVMPFSWSWL